MCPWHGGRAILSVIWEDDIKPHLIKGLIGIVFVVMGLITGTVVVIGSLLLYKFMSFI